MSDVTYIPNEVLSNQIKSCQCQFQLIHNEWSCSYAMTMKNTLLVFFVLDVFLLKIIMEAS